MPKKRNTNSNRSNRDLANRLAALERNVPGRAGAKRNVQSKMVVHSPSNKDEAELSGSVLRMMTDPCHAPPVSFPDQFAGKTVLIRSQTRAQFTLDGGGNRGIYVTPSSSNKINFSGASTYSTWTQVHDALQTSELTSSDYVYGRTVAMCATVKPLMPSTDTAPDVRSWCGPQLVAADRTAAGVGFTDKPSTVHEVRSDAEVGWCARQIADFVPRLATSAYDAGTTIVGANNKNAPAIHFDLQGGSASAPMVLEVTCVYEMFYSESQQFKPGVRSPTNLQVASVVINAIPTLKWVRDGAAIARVTEYANRVYKIAQRPDVQRAWSVGKALAIAVL